MLAMFSSACFPETTHFLGPWVGIMLAVRTDMLKAAMGQKVVAKAKGSSQKKPATAKAKAAQVSKKNQPKDDSPEEERTHKSSKRRRFVDSAYHTARKTAEKTGLSPNTCKSKARSAASEARLFFDQNQS